MSTTHGIICELEVFNYDKESETSLVLETGQPPCRIKLTCTYTGDSPNGVTEWRVRPDFDPYNLTGDAFLTYNGGGKTELEAFDNPLCLGGGFGSPGGGFGEDDATTTLCELFKESTDGSTQIKTTSSSTTEAVFHITLDGEWAEDNPGIPNPDYDSLAMDAVSEYFVINGGPVVVYAKREDNNRWEEKSIWLHCREHTVLHDIPAGYNYEKARTTNKWACPDWVVTTSEAYDSGPYDNGESPSNLGKRIRVTIEACVAYDAVNNVWTSPDPDSEVEKESTCCETIPSGADNNIYLPCGSTYDPGNGQGFSATVECKDLTITAPQVGQWLGSLATPLSVRRRPNAIDNPQSYDSIRHHEFDVYFGQVPLALTLHDFDGTPTPAELTTAGINADGQTSVTEYEYSANAIFSETRQGFGLNSKAIEFPVIANYGSNKDKVPADVKLITTINGCSKYCCPVVGECNECEDAVFLGSPPPGVTTVSDWNEVDGAVYETGGVNTLTGSYSNLRTLTSITTSTTFADSDADPNDVIDVFDASSEFANLATGISPGQNVYANFDDSGWPTMFNNITFPVDDMASDCCEVKASCDEIRLPTTKEVSLGNKLLNYSSSPSGGSGGWLGQVSVEIRALLLNYKLILANIVRDPHTHNSVFTKGEAGFGFSGQLSILGLLYINGQGVGFGSGSFGVYDIGFNLFKPAQPISQQRKVKATGTDEWCYERTIIELPDTTSYSLVDYLSYDFIDGFPVSLTSPCGHYLYNTSAGFTRGLIPTSSFSITIE